MQLIIRTLTLDPNSTTAPEVLEAGAARYFQQCAFHNGKWQALVGHLLIEDGDQDVLFRAQTGVPGKREVSTRTLVLGCNVEMEPEQFPKGTVDFFKSCHFDAVKTEWHVLLGHIVLEQSALVVPTHNPGAYNA